MKILYVRENVDKPNWGARATSMALRQLIEQDHEVIGAVRSGPMGRWYRDAKGLPLPAYEQLCSLLDRQKVSNIPFVGSLAAGITTALGTPRAMTHDLERNAALVRRAAVYHPEIATVLADLDRCDALMMNLEGDGIFPTQPRRHFLFFLTLIHLARIAGKQIYVLNGMLSADPRSGINTETLALARQMFEGIDLLALREPVSKRFQETHMPAVKSVMRPDAVFTWQHMFADADHGTRFRPSVLWTYFDKSAVPLPDQATRPYVAIGGSSAAIWQLPTVGETYRNLVNAVKRLGLNVVLVESCHGDGFLRNVARETGVALIPAETPIAASIAILAHARLFISGRWHPSIMASLNGTPSVFMGSNSHKTLTIQQQLEYPDPHEFAVTPSGGEIAAIVDEGAELLNAGGELRERIATVAQRLGIEAAALRGDLAAG
ncbi:polysaccharide pyruvyl transferase family protein [Croceicoccus sp. Ery5]|uniref:polysaccharide pyruvyl transferase family protein n=1 Tax=Croceicoccus sp. Ery5 TaxID=1703340 RepID=UPI001E581E8D|nr:polysaccharide pyruvyl transferase family protein [Croceicoccus sp. Ery5]